MRPATTALALCLSACSLVISLPGAQTRNESAAKPNILLIVADDLGYADVGFNGAKTIKTPNIDRLAAAGIKLSDFRACPMCSPTRAGLLTGRWPLRFGMMRAVVPPWSTNGMPASENTLPELLAPAGYEQRAAIGKWHLGHATRDMLPLSQGFTSFYGHYNGAIDYFDHTREGETDWHRNWQTAKEEGYSTDLLAAEAERFINRAPEGKPWLLYLAFNAPHSPYEAKQEDLKRYPELKMPDRRKYAAMVDCMDQGIGRVLTAVDKRADATNTFVLFMSDNGGLLRVGSNGPWRGAKLTVYEGGTRVCAAIRWLAGGLAGGGTFDGRIGYIDVLPTLLAAAGISVPNNLDGINFLPAIRGQGALPNRQWFSYVHQSEDAHASVHDGDWKLVAHGDFFSEKPAIPPQVELYNLRKDARETRNLADENPQIADRLGKALREFGKLQKPGGTVYSFGRDGFKAPKDWQIN